MSGARGRQDDEGAAGPRRPHPPALLESALRRAVRSRPSARFIVGDLREEYADQHLRHGGLRARAWYLWEVARMAPRYGGLGMFDSMLQDVQSGGRSLRRRPGLSLAAGLILALTIGATTAIFSVVDAVLLEPLPFPDPERVVRLGWSWSGGESHEVIALSELKFAFWRDNSDSFEALATYRERELAIGTADGDTRPIGALAVSRGFLQVIGTPPLLGRDFTAAEDRAGGPRVVILGDPAWRELFGADPEAIGRTLTIDDAAHTVVGVLPPDFRIPTLDAYTGMLVPLQAEPDLTDRGHNTDVIGRLRAGLDSESAAALEAIVTERFAEAHPDRVAEGERLHVLEFLSPYLQSSVRRVLWIMLAAVGVVLLVACANVAGLMLVKAAGRRRELAARVALGASRGRIVRQLLVESLMLAGVASVAGTLLAWGTLDVLLAMVPYQIPRLDEVGVDLRILAATVLLALGAGTFFGTAAAIPATRRDPAAALRDGGRSASRGHGGTRTHKLLVTAQVALSVAMLSASGVLLVTLVRLAGADLGFAADDLYSVRLQPVPGGLGSADATRALATSAGDAIAQQPGIVSTAIASTAPLERGFNFPATVTAGDGALGRSVELRSVGPGYFAALGTPLLRGRDFAVTDRAGAAPVAVINDALAERLPGGGGGALGAQVAVGYLAEAGGWVGEGLEGPPFEVVGVVGDVKEYGAVGAARPTVYLSVAQTPDGLMRLPRVLVRAASPAALTPVRERLLALEPRLRAVEVVSMRDEVADSIAGQRFNAVLMGCFGVMALVLTLVGLYGMLADAVGRRVHEIGIRMALGARPGGVLGLVLRHALLTVSAGVFLGLAGAIAAGNALRAMTYEIDPTDPRLLAVVTGAFVVVALLACAPPALRATRIDPVDALRRE